MRIEPDAGEAARESAAVQDVIRGVLGIPPSGDGTSRDEESLRLLDLRYPGSCAWAYQVQTARRSGHAPGQDDQLATLIALSEESAERASKSACAAWQVDLAPSEPHLRDSLARALKQTPPKADGSPTTAQAIDWGASERAVLCATACLLAEFWPEVLAELAAVVRQVVLMDSNRIAGFTDFTSHGAVFLNRRRFADGEGGLPAAVHCAEALVHEGTHNRCNGANAVRPFLVADAAETLSETPLRSDPRPLAGLFQQLVVLERCCELYERLLADEDTFPAKRETLRVRLDQLIGQADQARNLLHRHREALSDHGCLVLDEAGARAALRVNDGVSA
ncbi:aKG-HExxH-type peptide beta-hydroxylase [Saccharopolyspora taberi]|uniref:HEXXH motif domain-containing protein n=1 Tax=Saccharopolyspora taberi TaxID=60895 RepID=A0ABN3VEU8_9PSEU